MNTSRTNPTPPSTSPAERLREYAVSVVRKLKERDYIAYFAGGCVRDQIMGRSPSDYDVATNATPEEVQRIFGREKSVMIGAAFGVVCIHQRIDRENFQVEVATFRSDGHYIDGRRPESVVFSSPEIDAQRRDFTINGIFYDPIERATIDFVDGQNDIRLQVIRAIGDARTRFSEDRLRLLRAIRFAARFQFQLAPNTREAIAEMADRILEVSSERIAAELRKMLAIQTSRRSALDLMNDVGLLRVIFPEAATVLEDPELAKRTLQRIESIDTSEWIVVVAALLWDRFVDGSDDPAAIALLLKTRWHLSNEEALQFRFTVRSQEVLLHLETASWSRIQPLLLSPFINGALSLAESLLKESHRDDSSLDRLRETLSQDISLWNPLPIVDGHLLMEQGIPIGPVYAKLIQLGRDAQLDDVIRTVDDAREWLKKMVLTNQTLGDSPISTARSVPPLLRLPEAFET